ncbi:hypothetical protein APS56_13550 [Pseudalgibacter alginicilyticus]|uniref:DUF4302 domain-containing protein n=1 Tax=Pseudalgibacter alginicilyticus TaxID=1736674 RepID=A0A0P0D7J6_9FLAO|nr:DUF4302 domain-containing protein [Pseudalgibacter alginicilyticus]ALJ06093.1 hypothetical protein APS56_13550 [Pseudalgibacter alginicilyticus]
MLVSFLSCNNDNEETLFSETPAERIANQNSELLNLLLSETQGYKVVYFPKNDEFGGFTFYMKFSEDGTVQMTSDFDSETGIETSSYEVRIGTTTELIFTTRNHIQKVSNPDYPGLVGTGFKGTSVFQYFGYENGVINFKDIRNRDLGHFSMTPSNLSNFTAESIEKVEASFARRQSVIPSETTSVIQSLKIETDAKVSRFNLNYDELSLHASPSIIIEENGVATINEFNFGIAFTEEGLIISPALEFEGEVYETFDYDVNSNSFIATVNGTTATIFDSDPAFLKDDVYELGFPGHQEFWYFPEEDGVNPLTSPGFDALVETLNLNLQNDPATSDWSFYGFQYFATPDSDGDVLLVIYLFNPNSGFEAAAYWFTPEIADNKLYLNFTGFLNATGNTVFDSMLPILIFFNSSEGLYFEDHGSFESDTANYINLSSTFISADQPNLRVYGLWYE